MGSKQGNNQKLSRRSVLGVALGAGSAAVLGTRSGHAQGAAANLGKVHFAMGSMALSPGAILAALALDTFTVNGLAATYTDFAGATGNTIAALIAGQADVAYVGAGGGLDAMLNGADVTFIQNISKGTNEMAMSVRTLEKLSIKADAPVAAKVAALKGKTIATPGQGSAGLALLRAFLKVHGLDADKDVQLQPSQPPAIVAGLRQGVYDAAWWGVGVVEANFADKSAVRWIAAPQDTPELADVLFGVNLARAKDVASKPAYFRAVNNSITQAIAAIGKDPRGVGSKVKEKWFTNMSDDIFYPAWDFARSGYPTDGKISSGAYAATQAIQKDATGKSYTGLTYEKAVDALAR